MKNLVKIPSDFPAFSVRPSSPAGQLERLSTAYTFARAQEENCRGRWVEFVATLLFGGCVAFSVFQSATASHTLTRSGALEQVVVRSMQPKIRIAKADALSPACPIVADVATRVL